MGLAALKSGLFNEEPKAALIPVSRTRTNTDSHGLTRAGGAIARPQKESTELTTDQRLVRDERWLFCKMCVEKKAATGWAMKKCCEEVARLHARQFPKLRNGGQNGRSKLTYNNCRSWLRKLGKAGREYNFDNRNALADNYVSGVQKARGDEEFWEWFRSFYLKQNKLSVEESYRLAAARTREDNPFATVPTISQTRYRVKQLPAIAVALARHGEEYVKNHIVGYIHRDWSEVRANEIWISDHRVFDCYIKVLDENGNWKATRPWLCGFMDAKSWYFTSWQIQAEAPNNATIRNGLAWGISRHGRPGYLYSDNGKDFKAQGFSTAINFDGHEHSILKSLGIKVLTSLPYNGRAKTVERGFKEHADKFDKYFAAYLGNKPGARPDAAEHFRKHPEHLPTLEQFCQAFSKWLELYHDKPNNGKIVGGRTPRTAFEHGERYHAAPLTAEELYSAFLKPISRLATVRRGFCVQVNKTYYYGDCLFPHFGQKLMVKTDMMDNQHVFVFAPDGRPIGECKTRESCKALATTDADRQLISTQMKEHRAQLKAGYTMLGELTGGKHLLSVQELLQLPEDFDIVKVSSSRSVKGASHEFNHYKAVPAGEEFAVTEPGSHIEKVPDETDAPEEAKQIEYREDKEIAGMADFHKMITARTDNDKNIDNSSFNQFIQTQQEVKDDESW